MGKRKNNTPQTVSDSRLASLQGRLALVSKDAAGARKAGSWSAVAAFHRQTQSLRNEFDTETLKRAELQAAQDAAPGSRLANMTPKQRRDHIREQLRCWPADLLQIAKEVCAELEID